MGDLTSYAQTFFREVPGYLVSRGFAAVVTFLVPYIVSVAFVLVWLGQRYVVATPAGTEPIVHEPSDIEPIFLGILGIVAVVSCIAALAAVYVDYDAFRHADPAIFWPIILTSAAVLHILRQRVTNFSYVCIMAVAVMIGILNGTSGFSPPLLHWQHPLAACLSAKREALGLKAGLSDYWLSRPTTISTNWRIQVDQIAEMGEPYYWGNDKNWYLKSFADPDRSPEYNFVVVTRLDTLALRERFGSPDRTETCGAHTVWLYDDSAALYRRLKPSSQ